MPPSASDRNRRYPNLFPRAGFREPAHDSSYEPGAGTGTRQARERDKTLDERGAASRGTGTNPDRAATRR